MKHTTFSDSDGAGEKEARITLIACLMTDKKYRKIGGADGRLEEALERLLGKNSSVIQVKLEDVTRSEDFTGNLLKATLDSIEIEKEKEKRYSAVDLILVHKYTDYYKTFKELERLSSWLNDLSEIGSIEHETDKNNHLVNVRVTVMDVPKRIDLLTNRVQTGNLVQELCEREGFKGRGLEWPEFTCDFGGDNIKNIKSEHLIIKPIDACASDDAHWMTIVSAIPLTISEGMLAQRFYNHYGILYKIYVVGGVIEIVPRPSVRRPDCDAEGGEYRFNTHIFKKDMEELGGERRREASDRIEPFREIILEFAESLSRNLQIRWLGIDIIIPEPDSRESYDEDTAMIRLGVIDVNYMPGYDGIDDLPDKFIRAILQK